MNTDWQQDGALTQFADVPVQTQAAVFEPQEWRFQFFGNAGEYFKIWIVNLFLTIITLSFYAPWAKVRRLRYFYGNTELGGYRFDFTALPTRILVGRIIALVLFFVFSLVSEIDPMITLGVSVVMMAVFPWLVRSTMRFRARNTKFGNSRFYFSASMGQTYWLFVKCTLAVLLSFGLLYPLALYWFKSYQIDHLRAGHLPFKLKASVGGFYAAVLIPYLLMLVVLIIAVVVVMILSGVFTNGMNMSEADMEMATGWLGSIFSLIYIVMLGYFVPLTQGYLFQTTWQDVRVGNSRISTDLKPSKFAWIKFTNYLATVFTLGMLHPWGVVRLYRYQAETMKVYAADNPEDLMNEAQQDVNAVGEEIADVFDIDISL
ncbi:YjgN family protein [Neisseria sp. CCUG12390]|uniref:YjgN family protein n=1 Tax=Neisseria sp. CCUG12390 TaxID=3392035 RepID=UPI003A0FBDE2